MTLTEFIFKAKRRLWSNLVRYTRRKPIYPFIYRSYWHDKLSQHSKTFNNTCYYSARPNPGAGIGHQLANWIAGYWFAKQFDLKFAHIPFSTPKWEDFLGFGVGEMKVNKLLNEGYRARKLPLFDENKVAEVELTKSIIQSYSGQKVVFIAEQDQFYKDQYGVMEVIRQKFRNAPSRKNDKLIYNNTNFNIAIHVRRGDIVIGQENKNQNLMMRWQDNDYFTNVLTGVLKEVKSDKPIFIYLFSQGEPNEFSEFDCFKNLHFCLGMNAQDSFLHMVYADLLITSKSSFSYKPALLNNGIKVCPRNFWHGYPETSDFILANDDGVLLKTDNK